MYIRLFRKPSCIYCPCKFNQRFLMVCPCCTSGMKLWTVRLEFDPLWFHQAFRIPFASCSWQSILFLPPINGFHSLRNCPSYNLFKYQSTAVIHSSIAVFFLKFVLHYWVPTDWAMKASGKGDNIFPFLEKKISGENWWNDTIYLKI